MSRLKLLFGSRKEPIIHNNRLKAMQTIAGFMYWYVSQMLHTLLLIIIGVNLTKAEDLLQRLAYP